MSHEMKNNNTVLPLHISDSSETEKKRLVHSVAYLLLLASFPAIKTVETTKSNKFSFFSVRFPILRPHKEIGIKERSSRELIITAY
jgi:hypothetical protein